MRESDIQYIAKACEGSLFAQSPDAAYRTVNSVSIDSRKVAPGDLFFCIVGARSDAHNYLNDVRAAGCRNVVVSDKAWAEKMAACGDVNVVLTEDTTWALVKLATYYMDEWEGLRRVAVTGSVGKTSTKEFIYAALRSKFRTGKNPGNLNSEWGIPLSCFGFEDNIEVSINEIGLGYSLDMRYLVNIIKPHIAVVTTIGSSHLEDFGSREELLKAKLRITTGLPRDGSGVLVVNSDCPELSEESVRANAEGDFRIISVGSGEDADYRLTDIKDAGIDGVSCTLNYTEYDVKCEKELRIPIIGAHNLFNAALAVAVAVEMGMSVDEAISALGNVEINANRLDVRRSRYTVINDTYNASPESMKAGIDVAVRSKGGRKIAILGDMFELGDGSERLHASVGEYGVKAGLDIIVTVGKLSKAIAEAARGVCDEDRKNGGNIIKTVSYDTLEQAKKGVPQLLEDGDVVLVKASNSMRLYDLVDAITE